MELLLQLVLFFQKFQRCPNCGDRWNSGKSGIGKELYVCKCGIGHSTGQVEWAHLDPKTKRDYFLWNTEIGMTVLFTGLLVVASYFLAGAFNHDRTEFSLFILTFCLLVASPFVLIGLLLRMVIVKQSIKRVPNPDPMFHPGSMPWKW
jgi:hypothetical protein